MCVYWGLKGFNITAMEQLMMAFIGINKRLRYTKNEAQRLAHSRVLYQAGVNAAMSLGG